MRKAGTKYEEIDQLPKNALPVSTFATNKGMQVGHVYMKHDRYHIKGESRTDPGYIIRCFLGSNYVIPTGVLQK